MIKSIVLTGAAGKLAKRLRKSLAIHCETLISTDILPIEPMASNERVQACDLTDMASVERLLDGADSVVHFAGYPREASWDIILPANIVSSTNLWEAAARHKVRRMVYASSNHVVGFHPVERHIDVNAEVKCDSRYGVSKAYVETLARFYYEKFGLETLSIRIGRCEDRPTDERMMSTWVHPEDLIELVRLGLTVPVGADVVYGLSRNSKAWCSNPDLSKFPFVPKHSADDYVLDDMGATVNGGKPWPYQGGHFAAHEYIGDERRAATFYHAEPGAGE